MLRETTKEEVKTFYGKGYYSPVCRENNGLQLLEGLQHIKKYFFKCATLRQRKKLNLSS